MQNPETLPQQRHRVKRAKTAFRQTGHRQGLRPRCQEGMSEGEGGPGGAPGGTEQSVEYSAVNEVSSDSRHLTVQRLTPTGQTRTQFW